MRRYSLLELAKCFELHPNQISQWKQEYCDKSSDVFDKKSSNPKKQKVDLDKLYAKLVKIEVEHDYLKKRLKTIIP